MIENIRLSFKGIWSHKMRSFLTMLGIIIGIASLIAIVSTIKGTNEQIKQDLIGAGNNTVNLKLYNVHADFEYEITYEGIPDGVPLVTDETYEELKNIRDAVSVSVFNRRKEFNNYLYYKNRSLEGCEVYGIKNDYFSTTGYEIKTGRNFVPKDFTDFRPVIIIDESVVSALFSSEDPIGQFVEYNSMVFTVIGVVKNSRNFTPVINTPEDYWLYAGQNSSGKIFVPNTLWPDLYSFDEPQEVVIRAASTEAMSVINKEAADILNLLNTNEQVKYKGDNLLQKAKDMQDLSKTTNQQLLWIASISLLVGGIGVMNIMLVSVTERTKEIGIKKAIGAKKSKILWQFLTEASVLTSIGGILGAIGGIASAQIISSLTKTPISVSVPSIFVAVAFSMGIGILFGLLPSVKASNLNPIEALRHE